ncbi:MAG: hypothetical protein ACLGHC_01590 [Alphaproteobacteria bacterium]
MSASPGMLDASTRAPETIRTVAVAWRTIGRCAETVGSAFAGALAAAAASRAMSTIAQA